MEEKQVSVERKTYPLPQPFFVVATQNPDEQAGTYTLPESQLDRFLVSMDIGYPDHRSERDMLQSESPRDRLDSVNPVMDGESLIQAQREARAVHCSDALIDYAQALIEYTRSSEKFSSGYSPRAGMGLLALARSWAYIHGRNKVIPEDLQAIVPATTHHLKPVAGKVDAFEDLLKRVAIP